MEEATYRHVPHATVRQYGRLPSNQTHRLRQPPRGQESHVPVQWGWTVSI